MRISVHAGHGLPGRGSIGAVGYIRESESAREIVKHLIPLLEQKGHTVTNHTVDAGSQSEILGDIVRKVNLWNPDIALSIHLDSCKAWDIANGVSVYIYRNAKDDIKKISEKIMDEMSVRCGYRIRGVFDGSNLYVVRKTKCPTILIECGYVNSRIDVKKFDAEKIAQAISKALDPIDIRGEEYMYKIKVSGKYDADTSNKAIAALEKLGVHVRKE